jgi:hypothetical protein
MIPRALAALALTAAGSVAYAVVSSVAEALALAVLGVCAVGAVGTWRFIARSEAGFRIVVTPRRPVKREAIKHTVIRQALPAPPRMIEGRPVVTATVLSSYQEVMK